VSPSSKSPSVSPSSKSPSVSPSSKSPSLSSGPSERPSDHTIRNWKIAFGVVVGVLGLVCVGLLIWLVTMYRARQRGPPFTSLIGSLHGAPMSYD
jgi:hypothetical protein